MCPSRKRVTAQSRRGPTCFQPRSYAPHAPMMVTSSVCEKSALMGSGALTGLLNCRLDLSHYLLKNVLCSHQCSTYRNG